MARFAEINEQLAGYYLLETSTADEAVAIAARIPPARHGSMEVRPILIFSVRECRFSSFRTSFR
jgi:hypothetical protein